MQVEAAPFAHSEPARYSGIVRSRYVKTTYVSRPEEWLDSNRMPEPRPQETYRVALNHQHRAQSSELLSLVTLRGYLMVQTLIMIRLVASHQQGPDMKRAHSWL